jgi:hypothetical protein
MSAAGWFKGASAVVGLLAAALWFWSAASNPPLLSGGAIGGTLPTDPFNMAMHQAAWLNRWAALATGLAVALTVIGDVIGSVATCKRPPAA